MSIKKITYDGKTGVIPKTVRVNQVWDDDMNEIKDVVNSNADELIAVASAVSSIVSTPVIASNVQATAHLQYLLGTNVQLQLDQTETALIGNAKTNKREDKGIYQTGISRVDLDVSVLSLPTSDTLLITNVNNIMFVNEIIIDTNSNNETNFIKSFGNILFEVDDVNTPLAIDTRAVFYAGIDKTGAPVYRTARNYDQDICYLVRMIVENTAGLYSIFSYKYIPDLAENKENGRSRFALFSGLITRSGAASISFGNKSMSYGMNSINYANNKSDPNFLSLPDSIPPAPMSFLLMKPNITSLAVAIVPQTVLNPTLWYTSAGATGGTAVANTSYQVYKVWLSVTGTIIIQTIASTSNAPALGVNAIFANRDDALAGLDSVQFPMLLPANDAIGIGTFYLRAGTAVNGSGMVDPNDFFFKGYVASSSVSLTGVTSHDLLTGKNANTSFLHVTSAQIASWDALIPVSHAAVTIGTANGLSLAGQVLSLGLASTSTTGALSSANWNTFNNKQNALTNPVTGTGTANFIPRFSAASTVANSIIQQSGNNIGIGIAPFAAITTYNPTALGGAINDLLYLSSFAGNTTNGFYNSTWLSRFSLAAGWTGVSMIDGIDIDGAYNTPATCRSYWKRTPFTNEHAFGSAGTDVFKITLFGIAILPTPAAGANTDNILTRDATTGDIKVITNPAITLPIEIGVNTSLSNVHLGTAIIVTASCTITIPNGLIDGYNASFITLAGVTLTIALGGSVVLFNNAGLTMGEKSTFTLQRRTLANNFITAGDL